MNQNDFLFEFGKPKTKEYLKAWEKPVATELHEDSEKEETVPLSIEFVCQVQGSRAQSDQSEHGTWEASKQMLSRSVLENTLTADMPAITNASGSMVIEMLWRWDVKSNGNVNYSKD